MNTCAPVYIVRVACARVYIVRVACREACVSACTCATMCASVRTARAGDAYARGAYAQERMYLCVRMRTYAQRVRETRCVTRGAMHDVTSGARGERDTMCNMGLQPEA